MTNENARDVASTGADVGMSAAGALIGLAIGGPVGAVLGAAAPPLSSLGGRLATRTIQRRFDRAERLFLEVARISRGQSTASVLMGLESSDERTETFVQILGMALNSDESLHSAFAELLRGVVESSEVSDVERLEIVAQSLAGLKSVQVRILLELDSAGGRMSARDISARIDIPEEELRFAVRDLEVRGMIKDGDIHPIEWILRELGAGVVAFVNRDGGIKE